jgi:hypothetical protein
VLDEKVHDLRGVAAPSIRFQRIDRNVHKVSVIDPA